MSKVYVLIIWHYVKCIYQDLDVGQFSMQISNLKLAPGGHLKMFIIAKTMFIIAWTYVIPMTDW